MVIFAVLYLQPQCHPYRVCINCAVFLHKFVYKQYFIQHCLQLFCASTVDSCGLSVMFLDFPSVFAAVRTCVHPEFHPVSVMPYNGI